jgi:spore germination cell wall hydrolase CwlJ-like protein
MDQITLVCLTVWGEARGECKDGKAAVARVIDNRTKAKYSSDGSYENTCLRRWQFSEYWADMEDGEYKQVAFTIDEAKTNAEKMLNQAIASTAWVDCVNVTHQVLDEKYQGLLYDLLTNKTMLYFNPWVIKTSPVWADPKKFVVRIEHHDFYSI